MITLKNIWPNGHFFWPNGHFSNKNFTQKSLGQIQKWPEQQKWPQTWPPNFRQNKRESPSFRQDPTLHLLYSGTSNSALLRSFLLTLRSINQSCRSSRRSLIVLRILLIPPKNTENTWTMLHSNRIKAFHETVMIDILDYPFQYFVIKAVVIFAS